jgi:hypothetical protein
MDVRKKLVELLADSVYENVELDDGYVGYEVNNEQIADYLIAHGVTVQEWISVKDRLPDRDGWYITQTTATGRSNGTLPQEFEIRNGVGRWRYRNRLSPWNTTHWQPMPQPPKGE